MVIKCFMIEPTSMSHRWLRRYSRNDGPCPENTGHYHNALTRIEDGVCHLVRDMRPEVGGASWHADDDETQHDTWPHDDARWPIHCACGYAFLPEDHWQVFWHPVFRRVDNGATMTLYDCPPGAMWDAAMWGPWGVGSDGRSLHVALPPNGGYDSWCIDGPSINNGAFGPGWHRTGEPPNITVTPSILTPRYHGWLRGGELTPA